MRAQHAITHLRNTKDRVKIVRSGAMWALAARFAMASTSVLALRGWHGEGGTGEGVEGRVLRGVVEGRRTVLGCV